MPSGWAYWDLLNFYNNTSSVRCNWITLGSNQQNMSLLAVGAEAGAGTIMAPLGSALVLVHKFNGSNGRRDWKVLRTCVGFPLG